MPRKPDPPRLVRTYAPDPARCATALLRLLDWQPPPAPAGAAAAPVSGAGEPGPAMTRGEDPGQTGEIRQRRETS